MPEQPHGVTAVVLAAGSSTRMGEQKLLMRLHGRRMIDWALEAACAYPTILVASPHLARVVPPRSGRTIVRNEHPELGMSHSLALADEAAAPEHDLLVFLGDKPLATASLAAVILEQARRAHVDVCFPGRDGAGGHPVYFSRAARSRIAALSGDTLHVLRDDPGLRRLAVEVSGEGAFADADDRGALRRLTKSGEWKLR